MRLGNRLRVRGYIAELQDMADTAAQARAGTALPSLGDLAAGCPLYGDNVVTDAQRSARDLLAELQQLGREYGDIYAPPPARILAAMQAYAEVPTAEAAHALRDLVLKWRAGHRATSTRFWLHTYLSRIDFHLQEWGDREAARRVAAYVAAQHLPLTSWSPRTLAAIAVVHAGLTTGRLERARSDQYMPALRRLRPLIVLDSTARQQMAQEAEQVHAEIEQQAVEALAQDKPAVPDEPVVFDDVEYEQVELPGLVVISSSLDHLPKSTRKEGPRSGFERFAGRSLPLVPVDDLAAAATKLRRQFPWMGDVIEILLRGLVGRQNVWLSPTILVGKPGCGKSRLARLVGEVLGIPVTIYGVAGEADSSFKGTSRHWSTGRASVPLQAIVRSGRANPLIVLDEIEKSGAGRENGRMADALVGLMGETAKRTHDPYLECEVDLSAVSYLATANSLAGIPAPLLDRFRILEVPEPGFEHLGTIVGQIVDEIRRERETDQTWVPDLAPDELDLIAQSWTGGSMRPLRRMVETLLAGRDALAARH